MNGIHSGLMMLGALMLGVAPSVAADDSFFTHLYTDKVMANVTVSPARKGPVEITIQLETVEEKPLAAQAVSVTLTNPRSKTRLEAIDAERRGEDRWVASVKLPAAGRWTLGLVITISDADKVGIEAPIVIK